MVVHNRVTLLATALGACALSERACALLPSGPVLAGFVRGRTGAELPAAVADGVNVLIWGRDEPLQLAGEGQLLAGPDVASVAVGLHMHVQHLVFVDCAAATGSAESIALAFGDWNDAFATSVRSVGGGGEWRGFDGAVFGGTAPTGMNSFDKGQIELVRLSSFAFVCATPGAPE
jgi:hypothetical protein